MRRLIFVTNNAYDTLLLAEPLSGRIVSAWTMDTAQIEEFAQATEKPDLAEWEAQDRDGIEIDDGRPTHNGRALARVSDYGEVLAWVDDGKDVRVADPARTEARVAFHAHGDTNLYDRVTAALCAPWVSGWSGQGIAGLAPQVYE